MDDTADYVDETAQGDSVIVEQGGYKPTSTTRAKAVKPSQPSGVVVARDAVDGEMQALCDSVGNNHKYGCIVNELLLPAGVIINDGGVSTLSNLIPLRCG